MELEFAHCVANDSERGKRLLDEDWSGVCALCILSIAVLGSVLISNAGHVYRILVIIYL